MNNDLEGEPSIDAELWDRVIKNDASAFEQVVVRHQDAVSGVAYAILGDLILCQDVAQETFWHAWRSRSELRDTKRLGGWLCGIARNLAHQALKSKIRDRAIINMVHAEASTSHQDPFLQSISTEERELVWSSLEQIPEIYREAIILYYRQGESIAELANTLEITIPTAKQRLSRGRDLMRAQVASMVEGVLIRSRPGSPFTSKVMAGIAALTVSMKVVSSVSAAGIAGVATKSATGSIAATTLQASSLGAFGGVLGGLLGGGAGLGGAWLGNWLPAQLAPSMEERRLFERSTKKNMRAGLLFTLAVFLCGGLLLLPYGVILYLVTLFTLLALFLGYLIPNSLQIQKELKAIRATNKEQLTPNPTYLKDRYNQSWLGKYRWKGRCYTSPLKLLGIPLVDIQFSDPAFQYEVFAGKKAFGWIAIGDRASGILLGIGSTASGLIAFGGMAIGLLSFGGLSIGLIAIGGAAIGGLAIGGGAIGYDALGGGAVGWHSATGGGAIAYQMAKGGGAIAKEYAVGAMAIAKEANTEIAKEIVRTQSYQAWMAWYVQHIWFANAIVIGVSLLSILVIPIAYRREAIES